MKIRSYHIVSVLFVLMGACVKPYDFNPQNYEKVLVVDGAVSNQPGPYTVSVHYTYPLDTILEELVTNAKVWVEDGDKKVYMYSLVGDSIYQSPTGFVATVGQSYSLHVEMPDGQSYSSEPQTLEPAPAISRIYGQYAELPNEEGTGNIGGIQFFIDSDNANGDATHFRYEWQEAYKIVTPYPAQYYVTPDTMLVYMDTSIGICYRELQSNSLIYATTIGTAGNQILEFPIRFISERDQQLKNRYTLLVKQYAISEAAYLFYKRLTENNKSGGSLFSQQTGAVYGNMISDQNPDESILGFFEVAGVSEKRQFFSPSKLDDRYRPPTFPYSCFPQDIINTTPDSALYYVQLVSGNVFFYNTMPPEVGIQTRSCTDCSFYANVTPPNYWEN